MASDRNGSELKADVQQLHCYDQMNGPCRLPPWPNGIKFRGSRECQVPRWNLGDIPVKYLWLLSNVDSRRGKIGFKGQQHQFRNGVREMQKDFEVHFVMRNEFPYYDFTELQYKNLGLTSDGLMRLHMLNLNRRIVAKQYR